MDLGQIGFCLIVLGFAAIATLEYARHRRKPKRFVTVRHRNSGVVRRFWI